MVPGERAAARMPAAGQGQSAAATAVPAAAPAASRRCRSKLHPHTPAASTAPLPSAGLLSLSDDLLELVLLQLSDAERARCALVCLRLAALSTDSAVLWQHLVVAGAGDGPLAHVLPFLARRGATVRRLRLSWEWLEDVGEPAKETVLPMATALIGAAALCAPTLRVLELELGPDSSTFICDWLLVDQWAAMLRQLRWLQIIMHGIEVTTHLGMLTQLQVRHRCCRVAGTAQSLPTPCTPPAMRAHVRAACQADAAAEWLCVSHAAAQGLVLSVDAQAATPPPDAAPHVTMELHPGCIPRSLEYLWLDFARLAAWPSAMHAATGLRQLQLSSFEGPAASEWRHLSCLTSLTGLEASYATLGTDEALPAELAALTQLEALSLAHATFNTALEDAFAPLSSLTRLTELDLSGLGLQQLPTQLEDLPQLSMLSVHANDLALALEESAPWLLRLTALQCNVQAALQLAPLLPETEKLQKLRLHLDGHYSMLGVAQLSACLMLMPALLVLVPDGSLTLHSALPLTFFEAEQMSSAWASMLCVAMSARPDVQCATSRDPFPSGLASYFDDWEDLVQPALA